MIITITLNPALDKTVEVHDLTLGGVNRISSARIDAGGKGINVSKVLKGLGGKSRAMGILAGRNGAIIKEYLDERGIENDFVFIDGETRTNLKIVDPSRHENTDINEEGPQVDSSILLKLEEELLRIVEPGDYVVFSGSIPKGADPGIYGKWIEQVKTRGARAVLDGDGEILRAGVMAGPYLVKPNIDELERMFDTKLEEIGAIVDCGRRLLSHGIYLVAISMGARGGLFLTEEKAIHVKGIPVKVQSTVGAGDSMVAALTYGLSRNWSLEAAVKLASATGTANVMTTGTQPAEYERIQELMNRVILSELKL